ncbi:MAG: hypothetical protein U1E28_13345 [Beijerinckiaceae bacterium]
MRTTGASILENFPFPVTIVEPSEALRKSLKMWEQANADSQWHAGDLDEARHRWMLESPGDRQDTKQYRFKSESDASLFLREYGNGPDSDAPGTWARN